jgi:hypothetical protein
MNASLIPTAASWIPCRPRATIPERKALDSCLMLMARSWDASPSSTTGLLVCHQTDRAAAIAEAWEYPSTMSLQRRPIIANSPGSSSASRSAGPRPDPPTSETGGSATAARSLNASTMFAVVRMSRFSRRGGLVTHLRGLRGRRYPVVDAFAVRGIDQASLPTALDHQSRHRPRRSWPGPWHGDDGPGWPEHRRQGACPATFARTRRFAAHRTSWAASGPGPWVLSTARSLRLRARLDTAYVGFDVFNDMTGRVLLSLNTRFRCWHAKGVTGCLPQLRKTQKRLARSSRPSPPPRSRKAQPPALSLRQRGRAAVLRRRTQKRLARSSRSSPPPRSRKAQPPALSLRLSGQPVVQPRRRRSSRHILAPPPFPVMIVEERTPRR